jgi:hypothetical protein
MQRKFFCQNKSKDFVQYLQNHLTFIEDQRINKDLLHLNYSKSLER